MKSTEMKELFYGIKNVEFEGFTYCEEVGAELPVFELTDISAEEWNRQAKISNTKAFIEVHGRQPVNYDEALSWVWSLIPEEDRKNQLTENELALALCE